MLDLCNKIWSDSLNANDFFMSEIAVEEVRSKMGQNVMPRVSGPSEYPNIS